MVNSGFQDPKTTWNAFKTRETVTTPQLASPNVLPQIWAKKCYKTGGKKRQNDKWYLFRAPTSPRSLEVTIRDSALPVVQMALQTEKIYFELIMLFIADTDTDESYLGINFS